jgi:RHS repeat-associated protein
VLTQNGTMQQTRYYLGDYEYNLVGNQYIYYVPGGDGLCAIVQYCPSINAKVKEIHYTYTDHLGSIVAVTDETGSLEAEQNFDPWGRFRKPGDWSYNVSPHPAGIKAWLYRGYTGHEHMPDFSLINMNGRMYDPILGRMLSPDIFTHEGSQGYNRFSYAHNNPMSNVDPDGNNPLVAVAIGAAIAAASYTYNVSQSAGGFSNWNWGTFSLSLVKGGIMGGFSYGIGHAFQAAGSVSTVVGNNQFLSTALKASTHGLVTYATTGETSSAYAAFFGDLAGSQSASVLGDIGGLAFSSAVGGAASWVDGGNFWEGAAFAAMGYLTNQQMHKYFPAPKEIPGHPEVGKGKYHRPSGRVRWKAPNGDIWEWDKQHGDVEVYDRQGNHKGSFNPNTNQQKPAVPGRTTPKFVAPGLIRLLQNIPRMMPTPTPSIVPFNEKLMELMIPPNYKNNNYDIQ